MNSKLNEDYFKTREVHKKNSKGNTRYLYWIIFCVIFAKITQKIIQYKYLVFPFEFFLCTSLVLK